MFSSVLGNPLEWLKNLLIALPAICVAFTFHEFAHAWVAVKMGDNTPRFMGRLTLNPMKHIDPFGLILLVLVRFGWGKPVMVQPENFKNRRKGELLVSLAGVSMNLALGIVTTFILAVVLALAPDTSPFLISILYLIPLYNFLLMLFNILPVPPLDGSKVLSAILWKGYHPWLNTLERYGIWALLILSFMGAFSFLGAGAQGLLGFLLKSFMSIFGAGSSFV